MQTHFAHMQINVRAENIPFYKALLAFLGWQTLHEEEGMIGAADKHQSSLWFMGQVKEVSNDYDGPGINHFAFGTETQAQVDEAAAFLTEQGIALLFETPRHRPDFSFNETDTYYQVMFETPDRILIEIVYTGPKDA